MREIKFRGKRVDNGEWVYGWFVQTPKGRIRIYWKPFEDASSNTWHYVDPTTVGQLLECINNDTSRQVYEGDIVHYDTEDGVVTAVLEHFVSEDESLWHSGFKYKFISCEESEEDSVTEYDVIGNVHDNPELLKP